MTVLLVPPPPLPPVQEDLPQDIDFDFHMDFSLDPLPTFERTAPAPQDYPESEHEIDSLRLSRTSRASLYSQYSSQASLPSVPASREDPQTTAFWGNFGVSSVNLDQGLSDMTAPLNIVKRERALSERRLSERRGGDRSGEPKALLLHGTNRLTAIYETELSIPDILLDPGISPTEPSPISQRWIARKSVVPSHSASVPHSPTTSAGDHEFPSSMPDYDRGGRKISLQFRDSVSGGPSRDESPCAGDEENSLLKYPPFPEDADPHSGDELLSPTEWGVEPPEMRRDSGHSSDGALVPATPMLAATRLPPARPPRPPPNLCPPVNGLPLPHLPEEQGQLNSTPSSGSAKGSQALELLSPRVSPPPPSERVDVRRHSAYSTRDSGSDFSYRCKATSPAGSGGYDEGDSESMSKWRPSKDPGSTQRQRDATLPPSPTKSQIPQAVRKLNPRSPLAKDGQEEEDETCLFSDTDEDDDFGPGLRSRARSAVASARRRSSMPESPVPFDIPSKAASILGLGDSAPESGKKIKRGGILGDISSKRLLARRRTGGSSSSSSTLRGHMRKLSEFDPIGFVKGDTREAHIDRNGDLWANVSAEAKKRPESTRTTRTRSDSNKGLPTLPQTPSEVDVAEQVELYNAVKQRALPPTPETPNSARPRTATPNGRTTPVTTTTKRARPGSMFLTRTTSQSLRRTGSQASSIKAASVTVSPPVRENTPRAPPRGPLPPPPPSPPGSSRQTASPIPGSASHQRSASGSSGATSLAHVKPSRDTLIPYFPPEEQLIRYVSPSRPLSHAQGRRTRAPARTPSQSQTMYESSRTPQHGISDAMREELIAALQHGNLTPEQSALLEATFAALFSRPSAPRPSAPEPGRQRPDEMVFPVPPPRTSGELLRPENALPDVDTEEEYEPPRSASVPPPRPPRRSMRRHSRSTNRLNVPMETHSDESGLESARDDRSDLDPAYAPPEQAEVSEWEPDTPATKTRFPNFMKRLKKDQI